MNIRLPLSNARGRLALATALAGLLLAACGSAPHRSAPGGSGTDPNVRLQRQADRCEVTLSGDIDQTAVQQLTRALDQLAPQRCEQRWLVLQAAQGQIGAAVTVGSMLRNRNFNTLLAPGTDCLTACVLVFAAGRERVLGTDAPMARLGISRIPPDADDATPRCEAEIGRAQAQTLGRYLRAMLPGATADAVFHAMVQADCRAPLYWRPADVVNNGLVTTLR
jgi:hypothetical protein